MTEPELDTARAIEAARIICDGRDPRVEYSSVLVSLEHCIATLLLSMFPNPRMAQQMLNEGLVQGVENRLALFNSKIKL